MTSFRNDKGMSASFDGWRHRIANTTMTHIEIYFSNTKIKMIILYE